jgi:flagellar hook-length control protein FliK
LTINPTTIPSAALPSSVKGGGNAPSKRPAAGDPFASAIAQVSGNDEVAVAGKPRRFSAAGSSKTRRAAAQQDVTAGASSADDDADDAIPLNVTVPAWLWAVPDQAKNIGGLSTVQSRTDGVAAGTASADAVASARSNVSESSAALTAGTVGDLLGSVGALPAAPLSQAVGSSLQTDSSTPSTGVYPAGVFPALSGEQLEPASGTNAVPTGIEAGAASAASPSPVPTDRSSVYDNQSSTVDPQAMTVGDAIDRKGSASSTVQGRHAGRAPAAYADAAAAAINPSALRAAAQSAGAAPTTLSSTAASGRTADNARSTERASGGAARAANGASAILDGQSPLAAALTTGRAHNGSSQNPTGEDAAHTSGNARARAEEMQASATQVVDAALAAVVSHPDQSILQTTGPAVEIGHLSTVDKTSPASAASLLSGIADRSAAIDDASLHRQMLQAIQLQSRNGVGDARLTLQPEYLGEVTIALRVEDGGVTAHVSAASTEVRGWLGANEALLRQGLSEQGLTLDRLIVSEEPSEPSKDTRGGNTRQQQQSQSDEQPRPRPRREESTFEITL